MNLGRQQGWGHMWGTIGSVLTPGSILDRRRSGFPDLDPENPEKADNFRKSRKLHVTYQFEAPGTLVRLDTMKFQNSNKILENPRNIPKKSILLSPERATTRESILNLAFVMKNFYSQAI